MWLQFTKACPSRWFYTTLTLPADLGLPIYSHLFVVFTITAWKVCKCWVSSGSYTLQKKLSGQSSRSICPYCSAFVSVCLFHFRSLISRFLHLWIYAFLLFFICVLIYAIYGKNSPKYYSSCSWSRWNVPNWSGKDNPQQTVSCIYVLLRRYVSKILVAF